LVSEPAATLEYKTPVRGPISRRGKGFLTVCGNLVVPGLGHLIAGFRKRGVVWFAVCEGIAVLVMIAGSIPILLPAVLVLFPLSLLAQLSMLIDAYRTGRTSTREMLRWPAARYAIGIGILVLGNFLHLNTRVALWYRDHLVEAFVMPTESMSPTIKPTDRVLVHKHVSWRRWDLVAFHPPESPGETWIFRIAGLPGEQVEIVDGTVCINGKPMPAPNGIGPYQSKLPSFLPRRNGTQGNPIRLKGDEYYVFGDNTAIAND
jgi:signal peptidase I